MVKNKFAIFLCIPYTKQNSYNRSPKSSNVFISLYQPVYIIKRKNR